MTWNYEAKTRLLEQILKQGLYGPDDPVIKLLVPGLRRLSRTDLQRLWKVTSQARLEATALAAALARDRPGDALGDEPGAGRPSLDLVLLRHRLKLAQRAALTLALNPAVPEDLRVDFEWAENTLRILEGMARRMEGVITDPSPGFRDPGAPNPEPPREPVPDVPGQGLAGPDGDDSAAV